MKKKLIIIFTLALILTSLIPSNATTAKAGDVSVSIDGPSEVEIGQTYKYDVTVSATAASIGGTISCSSGSVGGSNGTYWKDSSSGTNENITATGSISVTVSENASAGSTAQIVVSGSGSSVDLILLTYLNLIFQAQRLSQ